MVEAHREEISSFGVERLTLVGSYARGEAGASSDVDFLVEFREGRGMFDDYAGLLHFLEDLLDLEVDLVKRNLVRDELAPSILGGEQVDAKV